MVAARNGLPWTAASGNPSILLYAEAPQEPKPESVVKIDFAFVGEKAQRLVTVFENPDSARRFIDTMGAKAKGLNVFEISSFAVLEDLLSQLIVEGVTHVQFNPVANPTESPNPVPIGEVLESLKNRPT